EQYLDFLRNRTFRRSLLCHEGVALRREPDPELLTTLQLTALARPTSPQPDVASTDGEEFRTDRGRLVPTNIPAVEAALLALDEAGPAAVSFGALWSAVRDRLGVEGVGEPRRLAEALVRFYLSNLVALHVHMPPFVTEPGERPLASGLARLQAATGNRV